MRVDLRNNVALDRAVYTAPRTFATVLSETAAFQAFEQAATLLREDVAARGAIDAYQTRAERLRALVTLGAVSTEEQAELDRLRRAYEEEPAVVAYLVAQRDLVSLAQAAGDRLSAQIGLDFAAACGRGCCG